jgi:hypothetical protein
MTNGWRQAPAVLFLGGRPVAIAWSQQYWPKSVLCYSSWPGLSRPSTSFSLQIPQVVDARQTLVLAIRRRRIALAGHDEKMGRLIWKMPSGFCGSAKPEKKAPGQCPGASHVRWE